MEHKDLIKELENVRDTVAAELEKSYINSMLSIKLTLYKFVEKLLPEKITDDQMNKLVKYIEDGYIKFNFNVERQHLPNIKKLISEINPDWKGLK